LIANNLNNIQLFKLIISHSKLSKFLGVAYLTCSKYEELFSAENKGKDDHPDDSIIADINKIIHSSNYILSQGNMQTMLKDLDFLIENKSITSDYVKENNNLEINLISNILIYIK